MIKISNLKLRNHLKERKTKTQGEMGKPGSQPQFDQSSTAPGTDQSSASINHFSHPHPLQLSNLQPQQGVNANSCSGCKLEASGVVYSCTICNYFLHEKCSQMPQQITHPFDHNNHALSLLAKPAYPEGIFSCDACSQQGNGFSYHCQTCGIDLHILCASMPMVFTHQSHNHRLNLTFSPPYPNKTFSCDICRMTGSNNWLYRCSICEFDVHLTCVNALPPNRPQSLMNQIQSMMTRSISQPNPQPTMPNNFTSNVNPVRYNSFSPAGGMAVAPPIHLQSRPQSFLATPYAAAPTPMQHSFAQPNNFIPSGAYGQPVMPAGYGQQQNTMANQIIGGVANGIASGASQAAAQALIQGMFGGGSGGGNGVGGNDITGFSTGADMIPADQGTYFVSDGSFNQMDGGYGGGDANTTY